MKYVKYFLLLLLIPFMVLAEDCDVSKVSIISIEQKSITGNTEVLEEPSFQGSKIAINIKMYEVGDSITYAMTLKNDSEEDFMIDEDTFKTDSDYIEYTLSTDDGSNVLGANSTKNLELTISYKKEVEDSLLNGNKFDASNSLKLSLNTKEDETPLDTITTDNIKESVDPLGTVENPKTFSSRVGGFIVIVLLGILITYYTVHYKKKTKIKHLIFILSFALIPVVYAVCGFDLELESSIQIEKLSRLNDTIVGLSEGDNACALKYEGEVTDKVGTTKTASNVFFNHCMEKRNVIFGGFCWQVLRTTETGGTKMIYNGEPVDGKCETDREDHKGMIGNSSDGTKDLSSEYLYGNTFTYDITTGEFSLVDTTTGIWSDSTYENLIGKYTCINTTGTCSTLYYIAVYYSNTSALVTSYTIGDTNYSIVGTSVYNSYSSSPAMSGYMYNKVYTDRKKAPGTSEYVYGNSFTYSNGMYTLSGDTQTISNWGSSYDILHNTHYTCWNTSGTCSTISYIYNNDLEYAKYIDLTGGKSISDALNEMLWNDNVNHYNSGVKVAVDAWYKHNMLNKTSMLEDAVYCNARNPFTIGAWNPDADDISYSLIMYKRNNSWSVDLSCLYETDQFSVSNNKAKLSYPVGLIDIDEIVHFANAEGGKDFLKTGIKYLSISPNDIVNGTSYVYSVAVAGYSNNHNGNNPGGVRPVISLKGMNLIKSGTGSETDPWIIKE